MAVKAIRTDPAALSNKSPTCYKHNRTKMGVTVVRTKPTTGEIKSIPYFLSGQQDQSGGECSENRVICTCHELTSCQAIEQDHRGSESSEINEVTPAMK